MHRIVLIIIASFLSLQLQAQGENSGILTSRLISYNQLKTGFQNPPSESRLRCYWWWLNSMATKESITRDLEEMKAKGYGGASIVDAGSSNYQVALKTAAGPVFMSPAWMELYKHAVKEADRIGIELSVNAQSGWNPGGPSITPEFAMKRIVWSEIDIAGGKKVSLELPQPKQELYYRDILIQAIPKKEGRAVQNQAILNWKKKSFNEPMGWKGIYPLHLLRDEYPGDGSDMAVGKDQVIDLTANFRNGKLEWNAPEGDWTIIRYGYTCTGARTSTNSDGWEGLSVDHLSPEAFDLFSKTVIIPLIETAQSVGNSVKFLQTDSWEMGGVSWTANFPAEFRKFRGYDMQNLMPVLAGRIVENRDITDRFLHDYRKTIGDCVGENHYRLFYELAHKYGLGIHPESGGPHSAPVDALRVMGISDFPQGEFWAVSNTHRVKDDERLSVRQGASVAHTNGKRFMAAEGPTSIGPQWERSPKDLKGNIDRVFCSGVNRIVWHTFTSSPKEFGLPGNEYFAGTHLNPNVTWWEQSKDFISYLDRSSFLLQQGLFVADVLYYYGDDVPNFVFLKEELPELKYGYDWDKCSKDVLLDRASFDGEKIVLPDGMSYKLLMITPQKAIDLSVLKKVEALVIAGLTVIGPRPDEATGLTGYPESDKELREIAGRLWGKIDGTSVTENRVGKGRVIWGQNVNDVLAAMKVQPDFGYNSQRTETVMDYIHRATLKEDIYFVANRTANNEDIMASFRVTGKVPQLWNPITAEIREIPDYREENGRIFLPLHFAPEGSIFVIFKSGSSPKKTAAKNGGAISFTDGQPARVIELKGKWELYFNPKWGGPEKLEIDELKSWTQFSDSGIRYYSGTARYLKTFDLSAKDIKGRKLMLDLGNVKDMASIKINGHQCQVMWCEPFSFDITSFVREGLNELEVEVVNMWANRLIGDGKLPETQRLTKTNVIKFNAPDAEKYLRESGLLGPVVIKISYLR